MSKTRPTVREEFEKAFNTWQKEMMLEVSSIGPQEASLWAAKWAMERCAFDAEPYSVMLTEHIRQLAKELESQ